MSALRVGAGKLVLPSLMLLGCALLVSSAVDAWSTWRQGEASMEREQREKANAAAHRIEQFVTALQAQLGWTTVPRMPATSLEQRRINDLILLRQTPAITQVVHLDRAGKEELKVSRLVMDRIGTGDDFSTDVRFKQALANGVYFGPVYLRSPSEPYMSLAMAHGSDRSGVTIADVNLKTLWEAIAAVTVGEAGYAYAVDGNGRLIAHRDASLVPSELDLSALPQVRAALRGQASTRSTEGKAFDASGSVLSAHALVPSVRWHVFVEVPAAEVQKPFWRSLVRVGCMLGLAVVAALTASHLAARRVTPSGVAPA